MDAIGGAEKNNTASLNRRPLAIVQTSSSKADDTRAEQQQQKQQQQHDNSGCERCPSGRLNDDRKKSRPLRYSKPRAVLVPVHGAPLPSPTQMQSIKID